jgi:hypothetical protein
MSNKLSYLLVAFSGSLAIATLFLPVNTPNVKNATGLDWVIWLIPCVSLAGLSGILDLDIGEFVIGILYLHIEIFGIINLLYPILYCMSKKTRKPLGARYFYYFIGANLALVLSMQFIAGPIYSPGYFSYVSSILLLFIASLLNGIKYMKREGVSHL